MHRRLAALPALAAALALAALLASGCSRRTTPMSPVVSPTDASRGGRAYSLRDPGDLAFLVRTQAANTAALMSRPDVIGTGLGVRADGGAAILALVRRPVVGLPAALDGVPVEMRVVGDVVALRAATPFAKPGGGGALQMGTSTGNDLECSAGTLSCVVVKGGSPFFLSCNHVFARENAARNGERIDAPGRYDAHPKCAQTPECATLSAFQAISFTSNNTVDCAIAAPITGLNYTKTEAGGYTPSTTVASPSVGLAVEKTGRTTGVTTATIQAINVTIQVQYTSGVATFVNQIMTPGSFIRSGDSGSLMVTQSGFNPVGLCFAGGSGGSFENPIGPVLSALGVSIAP